MMKVLVSLFVISVLLYSCEETYSPKPSGFHRIDLNKKSYQTYEADCPFSFDYPVESLLDDKQENCWVNIHYPQFGSTIHLSYVPIDSSELAKHIEDSRKLAMKHLVKANDIKEVLFQNKDSKVYGLSYDFEGNTASNYQFFLTDSNNHFFRGAMYFNMAPNADSLGPVIDYIKLDLEKLIESFKWVEDGEG